MAAAFWFELLSCVFVLLFFVQSCTGPLTMASSLLSEKGEGQVRGRPNWRNWMERWRWDTQRWLLQMAQTYGPGDQYYVSSYFFTRRKEHSALKRWLYGDALRNLFYLSCGWTCTCLRVLLTGPGGEMASGNGPYLSCIFFFFFFSSPLFLGNGQLIRPSDLTLGGCAARDAADHILQFQTELQGCGSTLTVCGSLLSLRPSTFFLCIWSNCCACVCVFLLPDDWRIPHLLLFSEVLSNTHWQHSHFKDQPCWGGNWMSLSKVKLHFWPAESNSSPAVGADNSGCLQVLESLKALNVVSSTKGLTRS